MESHFIQVIYSCNVDEQRTPRVDLTWNPYAEKGFDFYDSALVDEIHNNNEMVNMFFTLLALCHTVMPEVKSDGMSTLQLFLSSLFLLALEAPLQCLPSCHP